MWHDCIALSGLGAAGLVFLGAGFGALCRYWLGLALNKSFPWGTLTINVLGGILIGFAVAWIGGAAPGKRLFCIVGILGGFTTFSSYSLEVVELFQANRTLEALGYVLGSNLGAIVGCAIGMWVGGTLAK